MLTKTQAIVLRTIKYGENKLIVDFLTEVEGRLSCVLGIPKTQKGKLKKQHFGSGIGYPPPSAVTSYP